ncbi:carbohydrate kinase family protein [Dysgonomonas termitidis]|uniref:Carbohydrate kinase PfkB domain-containing protein n=1 Tax=Dysgonomonas termitidis TaxID=1516126 RepID=A0ABV9L2C9_9BACT
MKKVVTLGGIMLRLATPGYQCLIQSANLNVTFEGGEANVAVLLSSYEIPTDFRPRQPKNDIAKWCISDLRKYNVGVNKITVLVLNTPPKWFGVTSAKDKPDVVQGIRELTDAEIYPEKLF